MFEIQNANTLAGSVLLSTYLTAYLIFGRLGSLLRIYVDEGASSRLFIIFCCVAVVAVAVKTANLS